jgi:hypothetical protein
MLRTIASVYLTAFLVACPFVCGSSDKGFDLNCPDSGCHTPRDVDSPAHCPEEGGNCVCQGAIQRAQSYPSLERVPASFVVDLPHVTLYSALLEAGFGAYSSRTPFGLASSASSHRVCALLQRFDC